MGVPTVVTKLDNYCDYLITSDNEEIEISVSVQRKQTGEYLSQMDEVRERISELQSNPTLLIEGKFQISVEGSIMVNHGKLLYEAGKVKSYFNSLNSLRMKGISIVETLSLEHTIWWLYSTHSYIQRHHYPKPSRKYSEDEEIIGVLMGIPGVGEKKANDIYGSYILHTKATEKKQKSPINAKQHPDVKECNSGDVVKSEPEKSTKYCRDCDNFSKSKRGAFCRLDKPPRGQYTEDCVKRTGVSTPDEEFDELEKEIEKEFEE